jgi:hypothetical protein
VHEAVGTGVVIGMPRLVLRCEGLALFGFGIAAFGSASLSWWLFAALFLAPDIGLAGYLAGPRIGAIAYNALHTITLPVSLAAAWPGGRKHASLERRSRLDGAYWLRSHVRIRLEILH